MTRSMARLLDPVFPVDLYLPIVEPELQHRAGLTIWHACKVLSFECTITARTIGFRGVLSHVKLPGFLIRYFFFASIITYTIATGVLVRSPLPSYMAQGSSVSALSIVLIQVARPASRC